MPHDFTISPDAKLVADLVNGQKFAGRPLPYLPHWTERLELWSGGQRHEIAARAGDRPAIRTRAPEGLAVLVYQSAPSEVTYPTWEKFAAFVAHKRLGVTRAEHSARGLPEPPFRERYRRFSKSLVAVGRGAGQDLATGLEAELVALANPYVDDLPGALPVRLDYRGAPHPDWQIEVFDKAPGGTVSISTVVTGEGGIARVPLTPGHIYMLDAVILRAPTPPHDPALAYETLWANLTFAVPAR